MAENHRQRLAWTLLLSSAFLCLTLTISVPLMANAAVQNATRPLIVQLQTNQGTVVIDDEAGTRTPLLPTDPAANVAADQTVLTNATDTAIMLVHTPDGQQLLARLQIYGNTSLRIEEAAAPRFGLSSGETRLLVRLINGRIRLKVLPGEQLDRPILFQVDSPQGLVEARGPGEFSVEVSNTGAQIAVQEGTVTVISDSQAMNLVDGERAVLKVDEPPAGPLSTERNLVANGDFSLGLSNWALLPWGVERADQPEGTARVSTESGEPVFYVRRDGIGHADVTLRQSINQDVTDFASLLLQLTFRIDEQSLDVCGIQGSECPLTIRLSYDDENGQSHTWQQGFYSSGAVAAEGTPDICLSCAMAQRAHLYVPPEQLYFYEIDFPTELAQIGAPLPNRIKSVSLVIAGHTFETEVADVALIGTE